MGGHRKTVRRGHEPGDCHELTFSCYHRKPLLTNDDWRCLLARSIDRAADRHCLRLVAFMFMPEYVHVVVYPTSQKARVDLWLKAIKQTVAVRVRRRLAEAGSPLLGVLTVRERPGLERFRFWQEGGGYGRNLHTEAAVLAAVDYIHSNPVRRGLCERAVDWAWSSARHHLDPDAPADPDLPAIHGLPPEFFGTSRA